MSDFGDLTFRILVTGTRRNSPLIREFVHEHLHRLVADDQVPQGRRIVIIHGQCPEGGVDWYAEEWAKAWGHTWERHPADWGRYGKAAGPRRNTAMVASRPNWCVGFPAAGSRGTWDCLRKALDAGIPTDVHVVGPYLLGP